MLNNYNPHDLYADRNVVLGLFTQRGTVLRIKVQNQLSRIAGEQEYE